MTVAPPGAGVILFLLILRTFQHTGMLLTLPIARQMKVWWAFFMSYRLLSIILFLVTAFVWFFTPTLAALYVPFDAKCMASIGDSYGVSSSLFAMLAFVAAAVAVMIQYDQLKVTQRSQSEERMVSMLSAKLAAIPHLIEHCNKRLEKVPDPQIPQNIFCGSTEQSISQLDAMVIGSENEIAAINEKIQTLNKQINEALFDARRGVRNTNALTDQINELASKAAIHQHLSKSRRQYQLILKERFEFEKELSRIYDRLSS